MRLAELIFERIKHGDDEHRSWLKAKAEEIAAEYHDELAAVRAAHERVETLVPELIRQARVLRYGRARSVARLQAIAIEGVVQQLKLVLGGES